MLGPDGGRDEETAMTGRRIGLLLVSAGIFLPGVCWAQSERRTYPPCNHTPTESDVAAAKGAFQAGKVSFDESEYSRAIDYWEDAYRRDCTATGLLLNLSRAYELNGDLENAIVTLEEYMIRNPETPQRAQLERRIEVLRERMAKAPHANAATTTAETSGADEKGEEDTQQLPPPPALAESAERPLWPLFVAGGGALITIVGGILYMDASSDVDHYQDLCGGFDNCPREGNIAADANDASNRKTTWGVVTLGGLVVLGGGVAWYFLNPAVDDESAEGIKVTESMSMTPLAGPRFAGLEFQGSF